jgi:hypothetical protein
MIFIGLHFGVRAINHGVVVSSTGQQQRTCKGVARELAKHFTNSSGVHPGAAGRTDTTKSKRRFNGNSGQTRKPQNSVRPQRRRQLSKAVNTTNG